MNKQTAVEWLQEAMSKKLSSEIGPYFLDLFEQAKAMEFNQIIEAHYWGGSDRKESKDPFRNNALNYYHEIFGL